MQSRSKVILFLDLDDVMCINAPYTGHDAIQALREPERCAFGEDLWARLFFAAGRDNLRALHDEFAPTYIVSSTWRQFRRSEILQILARGGLDFVAASLHRRWRTTLRRQRGWKTDRAGEIALWLRQHHRDERVLVIDDYESGSDLERNKPADAMLVLCEPGAGFDFERLWEAQNLLRGERH